jgi:SAM-dependent methyltransferase
MNTIKLKKLLFNYAPSFLVEYIKLIKLGAKRLAEYEIYQSFFYDKSGLEIGGPSLIFKSTLPLYQVVSNLDGVNFSRETVWEGTLISMGTFEYYRNKTGIQFIAEASNLDSINSESYDFVISSNCLEHIANPLKAIKEWVRVVKHEGLLLLVLPKKNSNFDHNREITKFRHLLEDFESDVSEYDLTHLPEILKLHDLKKDWAAGNFNDFKSRSLDNFNNRTLHHHVFDLPLILKIFQHFNIEVMKTSETNTDIFAIGKIYKF